MGKKFNKFLRNAAKQGIYVGDLNQASAAFLGRGYPTPPQPQAPQVSLPKTSKPPTQMNATVGSEGEGVGRAGKAQPRKRLSDLRIARRKPAVNTGYTSKRRLTT